VVALGKKSCFKLRWYNAPCYAYETLVQNDGMNKAAAHPHGVGVLWVRRNPKCAEYQNLLMGFFGLDPIVLIEGSFLAPCYET
jgi:hypothetical protein